MPCLYLLHLDPPYHHARHYLGWSAASDPYERIRRHLHGSGSPLVAAALDAGCRVLVSLVWGGSRDLEKWLKRRSHVPSWCPLCGDALRLKHLLRTGERDAAWLLAEHDLRRGGGAPQ